MANKSTISISTVAQTKMALHSIKHGFSNPIHGIVLGKTERSSSSASSLKIVDVVPVCHEVPTKPIVDMSLRLTDAYLQLQQQQQKGVKIVGWYTANANASDNNEEIPNGSACKIASSMAEYCAGADDDGTTTTSPEQFVLLLISTSKLADYSTSTKTSSTICTVYEKDTRRTFTQKVDDSRVKSDDGKNEGLIEKAIILQVDDDNDNMMEVCDFVDHLENGGIGDWLENDKVNKFCA